MERRLTACKGATGVGQPVAERSSSPGWCDPCYYPRLGRFAQRGVTHDFEADFESRPAIGRRPGLFAVLLPVFVLIGVPNFLPAITRSSLLGARNAVSLRTGLNRGLNSTRH
jgi:hypothetical protein